MNDTEKNRSGFILTSGPALKSSAIETGLEAPLGDHVLSIGLSIYLSIYPSMFVYIYIYIHRERETDR